MRTFGIFWLRTSEHSIPIVQLQLSRFFYQKVTKKAILLVMMNDIGIAKKSRGRDFITMENYFDVAARAGLGYVTLDEMQIWINHSEVLSWVLGIPQNQQ